jgi:chloride channel 3/4/5
MAHDEDHGTEHSHLLPRDRRLGSVIRDADTESNISSHVSRDEQLLGVTAVGERLPYNDYTTIDWLHDLVGCSSSRWSAYTESTNYRSKTLFDTDQYTTARACATTFSWPGTHAKDGLQTLLSELSQLALHS